MKDLIGRTAKNQGRVVIADVALGRGGEGSVYEVLNHSFGADLPPAATLVAKIYHEPGEGNRGKKVAAMISSPPDSSSVAWPLALIFNEKKSFVGYLMVKLSSKSFRQWSEMSNAKDRRATSSQFDVRYALTASRNLAAAIDSVHAADHRLGDINESNIFVGSDATVLIVDTDSAQIQDQDGTVFPCPVGKPEYTSAELSHGSLRDQRRTIESDVFAYAVAVFQMLTGGSHPTDGLAPGNDDPPSTVDKIRLGVLPGLDPRTARGFKPIPRIPAEAIPTLVQKLLILALSVDPQKRPSLYSFATELEAVLMKLKQCSKVKQHWFDPSDGSCSWCRHADAGRSDPWAPSSGLPKKPSTLKQASLPSVPFSNSGGNVAVRRAAPAVAGQQAASAHATAGGKQQTPQKSSPASQGSHNFQSSQQQSPSGTQSLTNGSSPQTTNTVTPQHPRKYKGKMILDYADGTWDVRPSMDRLLRNNPKVAWYCIREETPSFGKAWWDNSRPVARLWGLLIGISVALGLSLLWIFLAPFAADLFPDPDLANSILIYLSLASASTALLASLCLFFSAVKDMVVTRKRYGSLVNVKRESILRTAVRFVPIPVIYGPILLVAALVMLASWTFDAATAGMRR